VMYAYVLLSVRQCVCLCAILNYMHIHAYTYKKLFV